MFMRQPNPSTPGAVDSSRSARQHSAFDRRYHHYCKCASKTCQYQTHVAQRARNIASELRSGHARTLGASQLANASAQGARPHGWDLRRSAPRTPATAVKARALERTGVPRPAVSVRTSGSKAIPVLTGLGAFANVGAVSMVAGPLVSLPVLRGTMVPESSTCVVGASGCVVLFELGAGSAPGFAEYDWEYVGSYLRRACRHEAVVAWSSEAGQAQHPAAAWACQAGPRPEGNGGANKSDKCRLWSGVVAREVTACR
jgi:hypothetical protein